MVRPRKNIERRTEPMDERRTDPMDQDRGQKVDSPFSMTQIKTLVMDEEPARDRANLVRARLEQEMQVVQSGLTKSEPIMIKPDIVTSCAVAEPKAWGIEAQKKAKSIDLSMAIVSKDNYCFAKFWNNPGNSPRILWKHVHPEGDPVCSSRERM